MSCVQLCESVQGLTSVRVRSVLTLADAQARVARKSALWTSLGRRVHVCKQALQLPPQSGAQTRCMSVHPPAFDSRPCSGRTGVRDGATVGGRGLPTHQGERVHYALIHNTSG